MKCPRSFNFINYDKEDRGFAGYACLEKDCAVWDRVSGCCSEVTKTKALTSIADSLREMAKSPRL